MLPYPSSVIVVYTDPLRKRLSLEYFTIDNSGSLSRSQTQLSLTPFSRQIKIIKCQFCRECVEIYLGYFCMVGLQGGFVTSLLIDFHPPNEGSPPKLFSCGILNQLMPYADYEPVYLDFNEDYLIVKARTPIYSYSSETKQNEDK